jgi:glycosyltransferase involved in cell wall biosynthesis
MAADPVGHQRFRTLSVIVPVYNERNTVAEIVRRMRLVEIPLDLEILMVDDGSTDGTDKVLAAIEDSTVQVLRHPVNRGKGAAIRTGLAHARGDLMLIQDADLEYDPRDWPNLLRPVLEGDATVVYGSRFDREGMSMSLHNRASSRFLSIVTDVLYDTTLSDMLTGYKVFDRRVLDGMTLESEGFEFEPEFTAKVLRSGHQIYEVPIGYVKRDRAEGQKYTWKDNFQVLRTVVRYRFRRLP